jgi:hypothetical protein
VEEVGGWPPLLDPDPLLPEPELLEPLLLDPPLVEPELPEPLLLDPPLLEPEPLGPLLEPPLLDAEPLDPPLDEPAPYRRRSGPQAAVARSAVASARRCEGRAVARREGERRAIQSSSAQAAPG